LSWLKIRFSIFTTFQRAKGGTIAPSVIAQHDQVETNFFYFFSFFFFSFPLFLFFPFFSLFFFYIYYGFVE